MALQTQFGGRRTAGFGGSYSLGAPHHRKPLRLVKIIPLRTRRSSTLCETTDSTEAASVPPAAAAAANAESKKTRLINMLRKPDGSTIAAISAALGWQAHTTRAAITGLRKADHAVRRQGRRMATSA